jgi:hypothetical protein
MLPTRRAELYVPTASVDDIYTFLHQRTRLVQRNQMFLCIVRRPEEVDDVSPHQPFHAVSVQEEWWFGVIRHPQFVAKQHNVRTPQIVLQAGTHVHKRTHPNPDGEYLEVVDDGPILIRFNEGAGYFDPDKAVPDMYVPVDYRLNNETYEPFVLVTGDALEHYIREHTLLQESYFTARRMLGFKKPNDIKLRVKENTYIDDLAIDLYLAWREFEDSVNNITWFPERPQNQKYLTFREIMDAYSLGSEHISQEQQNLLRTIAVKVNKFELLHLDEDERWIDLPHVPDAKCKLCDLVRCMMDLVDATNTKM